MSTLVLRKLTLADVEAENVRRCQQKKPPLAIGLQDAADTQARRSAFEASEKERLWGLRQRAKAARLRAWLAKQPVIEEAA